MADVSAWPEGVLLRRKLLAKRSRSSREDKREQEQTDTVLGKTSQQLGCSRREEVGEEEEGTSSSQRS